MNQNNETHKHKNDETLLRHFMCNILNRVTTIDYTWVYSSAIMCQILQLSKTAQKSSMPIFTFDQRRYKRHMTLMSCRLRTPQFGRFRSAPGTRAWKRRRGQRPRAGGPRGQPVPRSGFAKFWNLLKNLARSAKFPLFFCPHDGLQRKSEKKQGCFAEECTTENARKACMP